MRDVHPSDYEANGRAEQAEIRRWIEQALTSALETKAPGKYMHDALLYSRFQDMAPAQLGYLMSLATGENLRRLGYQGAGASKGKTTSSMFTVALKVIEDEFPEEPGERPVIRNQVDEDGHYAFRGVLNKMEHKRRFIDVMDNLVRELLLIGAEAR